jgi:uncharacterized protein (DUF305 family)
MFQIARAALAAFAIVLLAACGSTDSSTATPASGHNRADVTFTQQMIPHHQQAVMMAKLAATHDAGPEVAALASRIEKAQGPEIEQMTGWLKDWGESTRMGGMQGMGDNHTTGDDPATPSAGGAMGGMMSAGQMQQLAAARGAAFDRLFLTQMVQHHRGAVQMAQREQSEGKSQDVIGLARGIEKAQTSEIAEMEKLLGQ